MIRRHLQTALAKAAKAYPSILITGPRQSGKTTLAKAAFPRLPYVTLEDPDTRQYAQSDPRRFLREYAKGAVFDEVQRVPGLLSYLQGMMDASAVPGRWILTGSHQFLLHQEVSQTLAGRVRMFSLLPFDLGEFPPGGATPDRRILSGGYPSVLANHHAPADWYASYVQTYLERDVRSIRNIDNLQAFQRFIKLCAARTGQLLNSSNLAVECGVTHITIRSWIGILEASHLIFLLAPYHRNFNKRIVKTPKLYFYDTGLACSLLGLEREEDLARHPMRGHLFETLVVSEVIKRTLHWGRPPRWYFWRDKTGHEVDLVQEGPSGLRMVEIKSGETLSSEAFKGLDYLAALEGTTEDRQLIYGGNKSQDRDSGKVIPWDNLAAEVDGWIGSLVQATESIIKTGAQASKLKVPRRRRVGKHP
jgi:hypothetical protein